MKKVFSSNSFDLPEPKYDEGNGSHDDFNEEDSLDV